MLKLFLDANVFFAAFYSNQGASSQLLKIAARKKIILFASRLVLKEADRNLRLKASAAIVKSFHSYLQKEKINVSPVPSESILQTAEKLIHPKDAPVLAAAIAIRADYLVTLDKQHFFTPLLAQKIKTPKIILPGDFLVQVYLKGKY